ncbi:MAG: arginine--tRNA ligase [Candidatus Hydrothermarchaeaceae archaeon]
MRIFGRFEEEAGKLIEKTLKVERAVIEDAPGQFGDAYSRICFELAYRTGKSPAAVAEEAVKRMKIPEGSLIKKVEAVNGYINFHLNYEKLASELLRKIKKCKKDYGRGSKKEKYTLEHTSANPDGPLHIGHGRNAIIGDSLARIMRFYGCDVETHFYINDMGKQLAVVVWGLERLKLDTKKKNDLAIAEVYIKANKMLNEEAGGEISEMMKAYEAGDERVVKEFKKAAKYCIDGIKETLRRINIKHDVFIWESNFVRDSSVENVVKKLRKTKYFKADGVLYLDLRDFGIEKELVLSRKDGTYLYTTRDAAYHLWKSKKGKVIDIFGADHKLVVQQLKAVLQILKCPTPDFIIYEFISLPSGSMSTRRGEFISLDGLIKESVSRARKEVEKRRGSESEKFKISVAESVGTGAVRYNIVRVAPEKPMVFKWEEALDFEKQGAPFIQYAYARACRILEKEKVRDKYEIPELTENERLLINILSKFPEAVKKSAEMRKPSLMATYVLDLANAFHRFYMFEPVLKSEQKEFRLNLVYATKVTLRNALELLGINPLENM